jgi:hypothetical protein
MKIKKVLKLSLLSASLLTSPHLSAIGLPSIFKSTPAAPEDLMRKNAEILFPNALAMKMGCMESVAKPFNPQGLARYLGEELKIFAAAKDVKSKQKALEGVTRVSNYVKGLTTCSASSKDVNFNRSIASKFPAQPGTAACTIPQGMATPPVSVKVGTIDTAQIYTSFIASLYNTPTSNASLCSKVASTTQQVSNNQEAVRLAQNLGIPTGITAGATYLAFGEKLTAPLASPGVGNAIVRLNQLDPKTFTNHFTQILKGVSAKENASKNPKAVANVVAGCQGEMSKVTLPLIQQVCQAAKQTSTQNTNNARIVQLKNDFGVPANAVTGLARYKIFDTGLVKSWTAPDAAAKMVEWNKLDPKGCSQHLSMILRGMQGDGKTTLNPGSTKIVVDACEGNMGKIQVPFMSDICQAAQQTHATNNVNNQISALKSQLGIPSLGPVRAIIAKTCNTQFLAKLNVDLVQKWATLDQAGATEYLDTLGQCFNGTKVSNPKMAHFIQDKCDGGLTAVPGAEGLCSKATAQVETYNNKVLQKALGGFDGGAMAPETVAPTDAPADQPEAVDPVAAPASDDDQAALSADFSQSSFDSTGTEAAAFSSAENDETAGDDAAHLDLTKQNDPFGGTDEQDPFANTTNPFDDATAAAW